VWLIKREENKGKKEVGGEEKRVDDVEGREE